MNNLLLFGFNNTCCIDIQDQLNTWFIITNLGEIFHYFGIEVDAEVEKKISLWQTTYLKKILKCF